MNTQRLNSSTRNHIIKNVTNLYINSHLCIIFLCISTIVYRFIAIAWVFFRFDRSAPVQVLNLLISGMVISCVFFVGLHFSVFMYNYDILIVSLVPLLPDLKVSRGSTGSSGERQS